MGRAGQRSYTHCASGNGSVTVAQSGIAVALAYVTISLMSTLTVELPDELANQLRKAVESGWFADKGEAVRTALRELLASGRYSLQERQQLDDIALALAEKRAQR
jgi:Arc/MetJ-type ribon-helix-helix transcriptional regulator